VADAALELENQTLEVTVSVGWAAWAGDSEEDLVRRADNALYAAKAAGRNAVRGES